MTIYKIDSQWQFAVWLRKLRPQFCNNLEEWDRRRHWHPTPVFLPGKSHGQRSLVGCSTRGREESDTTERLHFYFSLLCIEEGNGNPLQCSCLENPRDGGAWWAAVYGVAQSQTQLKWLSSSSSSSKGVGWGGRMEERSRGKGFMYTYGCSMLIFGRKLPSSVT